MQLRHVLVLAVLAASCDSSGSSGQKDAAPESPSLDAAVAAPAVSLAIIGDTQQTLAGEVLLGREENDVEREQILAHLAGLDVEAFVHLGDLVARGSSESDWEEFDGYFEAVTATTRPIFPVLGNHEYCRNEVSCARRDLVHDMDLSPVFDRFPAMEGERWYSAQVGGLGLVLLDTNFWEYGVDLGADDPSTTLTDYQPQIDWFESQLAVFESDPTVSAVIVFGHHPMYTNAAFVYDNNPLVSVLESEDLAFLRATFLPAMMASPKVAMYLSGHAHGFEHFHQDGIDFIVSGGGGGPRTEYLVGPESVFEDLYSQEAGPRQFNAVIIELSDGELRTHVDGFDKGEPARRLYEVVRR